MAEAFGAAVSVLTLLEQTIQSISKLRALRMFIKTVPGELEDLIEEIEIVQAILTALKPEAPKLLYLPSAERRLQAFQTSLESLVLEISKYKDSLTGQRFGALKLALKKDVLRMHRQNLENIKSILSLLQQAHHSVSLYELTATLSKAESFKQEQFVTIDDKPEQQRTYHQVPRKTGYTRDDYKREFRFRTPLILIDKLWTISTKRAFSTWGLNIQVNNVIPDDSPVMKHCWNGEIAEVQRLFSAGLASPFDCDPDGRSLLHIAACVPNLDMCRFLLQAGADPGHRHNSGMTPLRYLDLSSRHMPKSSIALLLDIYRLFIAYAEEEFFSDYSRGAPSPYNIGFTGPVEVLRLIQSHHFERYSELPLRRRWERAMAITAGLVASKPVAIRIALGGGARIDPAAFHMETDHGETLLHRMTKCIAGAHAAKYTDDIAEWRLLLMEAVSASADLLKLKWYGEVALSPLQIFLLLFFDIQNRILPQGRKSFDDVVCIWLSELKHAGVDLEAYGDDQHALFESGDVWPNFPVCISAGTMLWGRVLGMKCGPEPGDWHVFVTNPVDELVGEFWESVQRSLEMMPGTWID